MRRIVYFYPTMEPHFLDEQPGRTVRINSREYLFFSGYNYLGVSQDPEFRQLVVEGTSRFGWLFPSARISNTRLSVYRECEALLSSITGSEDTVLTSSGFSAGQMAVGGKPVINAPGSHPAILRERSGHPSFPDWAAWVVSGVNNGLFSGPVASDSLSPLSATLNDFGLLAGIRRDLDVIVDDSHGIGIIGRGKGVSGLVPRSGHLKYTFTYSLSKAFGIPGGAVSCSAEDASRLRALPAYTAVTPQSPGLLYAFIKGQQVYSRQLDKLRQNIARFSGAVADLPGISGHPELPVFILNGHYREEDLFDHGIIISSFAYPDPKGPRLNRIVLNALHTGSDLERLSDALHLVRRRT